MFETTAELLRRALEAIALAIIAAGAAITAWELMREIAHRRPDAYVAIRLKLARSLALALEFQLAADIVMTTISPTWHQLGELAAIAAIRTALNYFLAREMREARDH